MATRNSSNALKQAPRSNGAPKQPSALYSMIMTPINLTVFLLSLAVVDLRYSLARSDNAPGRPGDATAGGFPAWLLARLPAWLSRWLRRLAWWLRPEPYWQYDGTGAGGDSGRRWHYHTKQKKLIKMEADEAFQLYGAVLAAMGAVALVAVAVLCYVARRAYQYAFGPLAVVQ